MNIQIPNDADLPARLAELMGWTIENQQDIQGARTQSGKYMVFNMPRWSNNCDFLNDRNSSRLAVERCAELGLMNEFSDNIDDGKMCIWLVTPRQESRAAYLTLENYHLTKGDK